MARPIIRTCCCCDLRTGAILIALFSMGIAGINIYNGMKAVWNLEAAESKIKHHGIQDDLPIPWKYYDDTINLGWSNVAFSASSIFAGIVLLVGAIQRHVWKLNAWLVWTAIVLLYHLAVSIFFLSIWKGVPLFMYGLIVDLVIAVYFLLVVYSFKQQILEQEQNPNAGLHMQGVVIAMPPGSNPALMQTYPSNYPSQYPPPYNQLGAGAVPPPYSTQTPPPYNTQQAPEAPQKVRLY
ncbi:uncharacterized protein LOC116620382 [Nematostella vectensis]|uniref:uncharacterized protein LOC116620382 n=1 Tax=Nematostella vectensis TaxID=45351 RepID=UPI00207738A8|nr:uncharacterized protein LOC116620382 [Nematostella vectensis]